MQDLEGRLAPFDYVLPEGRIALRPTPERSGSRLLLDTDDGWSDGSVAHLADQLSPGDLLVVNDTRVLAARLFGKRTTGGRVEFLLLEGQGEEVPAMVRPGRKLKVGEIIELDDIDASATLVSREEDGRWWVRFDADVEEVMRQCGQIPLPPYIERSTEPADADRYQTVFAKQPGAVAAPTAGLHLDQRLIDELEVRGVELRSVTLHVGPGTFRNLRFEDLERGTLHIEPYVVPEGTAAAINDCRSRGGQVVAVGTTVTRTLESAARGGGRVTAGSGETGLFIQPGFSFQVVDRLLTNFHLPRTSLLMLVCAFGGRERVLAGYRHAIASGYRFYSYGDAMLLDRRSAS